MESDLLTPAYLGESFLVFFFLLPLHVGPSILLNMVNAIRTAHNSGIYEKKKNLHWFSLLGMKGGRS